MHIKLLVYHCYGFISIIKDHLYGECWTKVAVIFFSIFMLSL